MANLISVPIFNSAIDATGNYSAATQTVGLSVNKIISVKTLTGAQIVNGTGVTAINYAVAVNNSETQALLVTTMTTAQVITAANAALA